MAMDDHDDSERVSSHVDDWNEDSDDLPGAGERELKTCFATALTGWHHVFSSFTTYKTMKQTDRKLNDTHHRWLSTDSGSLSQNFIGEITHSLDADLINIDKTLIFITRMMNLNGREGLNFGFIGGDADDVALFELKNGNEEPKPLPPIEFDDIAWCLQNRLFSHLNLNHLMWEAGNSITGEVLAAMEFTH